MSSNSNGCCCCFFWLVGCPSPTSPRCRAPCRR
jgi:hypothetical protein